MIAPSLPENPAVQDSPGNWKQTLLNCKLPDCSDVEPQQKDSETLKALEIANIRLSAAHETIALLNERLKEKDAIIQAQNDKDAVKDEMIVLLKSANKERATVNTGDARMLEAANGIIAKQDAEIARLRSPSFLSALFDKRTAYGGIIGFGLCKVTNGGTTNPFQNSFNSYQLSAEERARQAMRFTK